MVDNGTQMSAPSSPLKPNHSKKNHDGGDDEFDVSLMRRDETMANNNRTAEEFANWRGEFDLGCSPIQTIRDKDRIRIPVQAVDLDITSPPETPKQPPQDEFDLSDLRLNTVVPGPPAVPSIDGSSQSLPLGASANFVRDQRPSTDNLPDNYKVPVGQDFDPIEDVNVG